MKKISKENLPTHVVIVPDGNRRWAREKGFAPWHGHFVGAEKMKEVSQAALDLEIKCLSIWGGSWNNLTNRSKVEIRILFKIYEEYFKKLIKRKEIHDNQVKVSVIGRWEEILPKKTIKAAKELIKMTEGYSERLLNFCIAYNGTDEMLAAVKSIVKEARKDKSLRITSKVLEEHLWSWHLPPVDFLIRTGSAGDPHNSVGFMMWQTANSQLYFTKTCCPEFGREEFIKAIKEFQRRERRLGK